LAAWSSSWSPSTAPAMMARTQARLHLDDLGEPGDGVGTADRQGPNAHAVHLGQNAQSLLGERLTHPGRPRTRPGLRRHVACQRRGERGLGHRTAPLWTLESLVRVKMCGGTKLTTSRPPDDAPRHPLVDTGYVSL
jgi:hypothetical protein